MLISSIRFAGKVANTIVVVAFVGLMAASFALPRVTDTTPLTVLTGSMSPTIPAGSLVFVKPIDPLLLQAGEVITWQARPGEATYITHRIVEVQDEGGGRQFITKGDANKGPDVDPVMAGMVRGTVQFHVPYLGRIGDTMRGPAGIGIGVAIAGIYALLWALRRLLTPEIVEEDALTPHEEAALPA